eukprot:CAMPEP_0203793622 /NCGR_PEP_ID=MMETSP0100_2-20121128/5971_1 /ASSEMBLY_ACC=CAM_ASM_000210 /TAXON_ID=96639 /ORGANISM=" , Strain NY0313808BC1" /LENGTH=339 /DNA_ID=CAMNT_0050697429 /DNA_START=745 /DNA_END=1760 /DNA_ORIENTATION=+
MIHSDDIECKGWAVFSPKDEQLKEISFTLKKDDMASTDVDVELMSSGLCHTDYHMMKNDWGVSTYTNGLVPGHEGIGKVVRVGDDVTGLSVGSMVGVGWIADSCKECNNCIQGKENLCLKGYTGTILGGHRGCFATHVRVNQRWATPLPADINLETAGPLLCAGTTVFAPLKRYIRPGMDVGILGIGGLGHLAVKFASKMGANVSAISRSSSRHAFHKELGASKTIATSDPDAFKQHAASLDLIISTCPSAVDWESYVGLLRTGGTFVLCGIPEADEKGFHISYNQIIFRQITIAGSIVAGSVDTRDTLECASKMQIAPNVEILPMSHVNEAIARLLKG